MNSLPDSHTAVDFIVGRIVAEAQRENSPLNDIEEKMLYFSEVEWTLPDMDEINAQFDQHYDQFAYEEKIGTLVYRYLNRTRKESPSELAEWRQAVKAIRKEDRYLLVVIVEANGSHSPYTLGLSFRPLKLLSIAAGLGMVVLAITILTLFITSRSK